MTPDALLRIINVVLTNNNKKPVSGTSAQTRLREDLGMDSFDLAELTVRVEDECGIDVFASGLVETVGELLGRINEA